MRLALLMLALTGASVSSLRAVSVLEQIDPPESHPGDEITITVTVQDATVGKFALPAVDGLQPSHDVSLMTTYGFDNGVFSSRVVETFHLTATHAGDFTVPAFDVPLTNGTLVNAPAIHLHVTPGDPTQPAQAAAPLPVVPRNGPVILPSPSAGAPDSMESIDSGAPPALHAPRDPDGQPAKVFLVARPETTQGFVKQAIRMQIDFYLRMDALAPQDSLPTVKGSDFLVTSVSERPHLSSVIIDDREYQCDTWFTAILPLKPGDLELATERDTYWVKDPGSSPLDPIAGIFGRHNDLAHENIPSAPITLHIAPVPDEGKPDNYTDAVGQFLVTGDAQPVSVAVGEPVTLYYVVNGQGNFNYVRCPAPTATTDWKTYQPQSRVTFRDEAHTEGYKSFEQSIIPLKPGALHLPPVSFSYFDPSTKQYVNLPIALPTINVRPGLAPAPPLVEGPATADSAPALAAESSPNRVAAGVLHPSLAPPFRHMWFWVVQAGAVLLPLLALVFLGLQIRNRGAAIRAAAHDQCQRSVREEEEAMRHAAQQGDAPTFFIAARHLLQMKLGARWSLEPAAISRREIERRDPALADALAPFFDQSDESIYSGRATGPVDFERWHALVNNPPQLQTA